MKFCVTATNAAFVQPAGHPRVGHEPLLLPRHHRCLPCTPGGQPEAVQLETAAVHSRVLPLPPCGLRVLNIGQLPAVHRRSHDAPPGALTRCSCGAATSPPSWTPCWKIQCLALVNCSTPFTKMGLAHLRGITRLHMEGATAASIAAARALGLPATTADCTKRESLCFSDTESGP